MNTGMLNCCVGGSDRQSNDLAGEIRKCMANLVMCWFKVKFLCLHVHNGIQQLIPFVDVSTAEKKQMPATTVQGAPVHGNSQTGQ